jgi:hypothetical protein
MQKLSAVAYGKEDAEVGRLSDTIHKKVLPLTYHRPQFFTHKVGTSLNTVLIRTIVTKFWSIFSLSDAAPQFYGIIAVPDFMKGLFSDFSKGILRQMVIFTSHHCSVPEYNRLPECKRACNKPSTYS